MVMIGMTIEEAKQKWTPIKRADLLEKINSMPITFDKDCPQCTDEQLKKFHRVLSKKKENLKERL